MFGASKMAQWGKKKKKQNTTPAASVGHAGDVGSNLGLGGSSAGGNGNSLQDSCQESPMERVAWWAIVMGLEQVGHD